MRTDKAPRASNEELVRSVIVAQAKGGCRTWEYLLHFERPIEVTSDGTVREDRCVGTEVHLLGILLDTDGAKAAYPGWYCEDCGNGGRMGPCPPKEHHPWRLEAWKEATRAIHWSWHFGEGNNVRAALESAASFLS